MTSSNVGAMLSSQRVTLMKAAERSASGKHVSAEPFQHPSALFSTLPSQRNRVTSEQRGHRGRYSPYSSSASSFSDVRSRYRRPRHFPPRTMSQRKLF